MDWNTFTQKIFDSSDSTSEIVWYVCLLRDIAISEDLITRYRNEDESDDLKRLIFRRYGLEAYIERPNCPSIEELFMNISFRCVTDKSCVR